MRYVDLSYPIEPHWSWKYQKTLNRDYLLGGPLREEVIYMPVHCFTHIDPPSHAVPGAATIDEIPLERFIGRAKVVDMTDYQENQEITAALLEARAPHVEPGDILIVKTCHGTRYRLSDRDFWYKAPYMDETAGWWFVEKKVAMVGFDFPQDRVLRNFFVGDIPPIEQMPMHRILLSNGILQAEYLTNLETIEQTEFDLFAIPLHLKDTAGSPARIFAVLP